MFLRISLLLTAFLVILSSCVPTINRLKAYETTVGLQDMGILVELPAVFRENDSISRLYDKYGFSGKAEKYAEEKRKQEIWIKTAFLEKFDFCKVYFGFDTVNLSDTHYSLFFLEEDKMTGSGDNDRFEKVLSLKLKSIDPTIEIVTNFPGIIYSNSSGYNLNNYRYLASELNRRLHKLEKERQKLLNEN